ncbi:MAG: hypothetical protein ACO1OG_00050 [Devosia sp.]
MDRLASGIVIAIAVLAINGGLMRDVLGEERISLQPELSSSIPVASGHRSERVLSLLLALEALRAAPGVLAGTNPGKL